MEVMTIYSNAKKNLPFTWDPTLYGAHGLRKSPRAKIRDALIRINFQWTDWHVSCVSCLSSGENLEKLGLDQSYFKVFKAGLLTGIK